MKRNDDDYEDVDKEKTIEMLEKSKKGEKQKKGEYRGR